VQALLRAIGAFIDHSRGKSTTHSTYGGKSSMQIMSLPGAGPKNEDLSVRIELSTIYQNDSGMVIPNRVPDKDWQAPPHDYTDGFMPALKADPSVQEVAHDIQLEDVESAWGDTAGGNERRLRLRDDIERRRREALARDQEIEAFKKQI
jgi:hypothetical protein